MMVMTENGTKMSREEYCTWLYNPDNIFKCEDCPDNRGFSDWQGNNPCGQQNCWVAVHCKDVESRFTTEYNAVYLSDLSDEELAEEINQLDAWDADLCRDLMWRADMLEEWLVTENFDEELIQRAADKLHVTIA